MNIKYDKPRVFIASPLFNPPQHAILDQLEGMLSEAGYDFYSARKHSGSDKLSKEDMKVLSNWDPVFDSNEQGLDECRVCIAVLEYARPNNEELILAKDVVWGLDGHIDGSGPKAVHLELPDAGTVWEMGYLRAQGKLVMGFHQDTAKFLNLMLSHGTDGMLRGFDAVKQFLSGPGSNHDAQIYLAKHQLKIAQTLSPDRAAQFGFDSTNFNWNAVTLFDAQNKMVE